MPISGLTDRPPRLPRLAKIRLGKKVQKGSGKPYPQASKTFRFDDAPELQELFGDSCSTIAPIYFPVDDEDVVFPTARKAYTASSLFCACTDAVTARRTHVGFWMDREGKQYIDPVTKQPIPRGTPPVPKDAEGMEFLREQGLEVQVGYNFELPCAGDECGWWKRDFCKANIRLFFCVQHESLNRAGCYEISTTSRHSYQNISDTFNFVRAAAGSIAWIPFSLTLIPQEVAPDGRKKVVRVLRLEVMEGMEQLRERRRQLVAAGAIREPRALIEAPDEVPDDLYPHGGAGLDQVFGGSPPPSPAEPEEPEPEPEAPPHTVVEGEAVREDMASRGDPYQGEGDEPSSSRAVEKDDDPRQGGLYAL